MRTSRWLALAALLAVMTSCGRDTQEGTSVQEFMESADHVESITVSDIYNRAVSEVVIVCAYTSSKSITDELGFDWSDADSLESLDEGQQAVLAVHDGEVVELEVMSRQVLDLCDVNVPYPATIGAETTSRLGKVSQSASLLASLAGLGFGCAAALRSDWTLLIPACITTFISVVTWFTRVRTTVSDDRVTFAQLGKRIQVRFEALRSST